MDLEAVFCTFAFTLNKTESLLTGLKKCDMTRFSSYSLYIVYTPIFKNTYPLSIAKVYKQIFNIEF